MPAVTIDDVVDWLLRLGDDYGVDPLVYAIIWVGALPLFLSSLVWLVGRLRRRAPIALPLAATAFFFLAPTLYVFVAGRNLPAWVYLLLAALAVLGGAATVRDVRRRVAGDVRRPPPARR